MLQYVGIRVRELDRSRKFYCDGLGLRKHSSGRMAAGGIWETLEDPESHAQLELNFYPDAPAYREGDELDHLGFQVTGLDEVVERLKALGGRIRIPPFREGETRLVFLSDPDGVWVELWERVEPEEPPTSRGGE